MLLLRMAVLLVILLTVTSALIHAQPDDQERLRKLLMPPEGCAMPCWQGIRPGVTTAAEAMLLLRNHPWIEDPTYLQGMGLATASVVWAWNDETPPEIDTARQGVLWIQSTLVKRIDIATTLPYGQFWLYDRPSRGALFGEPVQPRRVFHLMDFLGTGLQLRVGFICPLSPRQFWNAPVMLLYTDEPIMNFSPYPAPYRQNQALCRGEGPSIL